MTPDPEALQTEVWIRNPNRFFRECTEVAQSLIAWDMGTLIKFGVDPDVAMDLFFKALPWRSLVIEQDIAYEWSREEGSLKDPVHTWPVWMYERDPMAKLEKYAANGGRVIIAGLPDIRLGPTARLLTNLSEIQLDYPDTTLHLHGVYSWRAIFGLGFKAGDYDPRQLAMAKQVMLPNGKKTNWDVTPKHLEWVRLLGYLPIELQTPSARIKFNIQSAQWAGREYRRNVKWRSRGFHTVDPEAPLVTVRQGAKSFKLRELKAGPYDKFLCDVCSLQDCCRLYREGSVCAVAGSDGAELGDMFKTRDSGQIIEALGSLLATQADRLAEARESEVVKEEIQPEVTKIINTLFDRGVKLATLVDPTLLVKPVGPAATNNGIIINGATPAQMAAAIVAELEGRGVPRSMITGEVIQNLLGISNEEERAHAIDVLAISTPASES